VEQLGQMGLGIFLRQGGTGGQDSRQVGSLGSAGGGTFARGKSQRVFWPLEGRSVLTEGGSWSSSGRGGICWILGGGLYHFYHFQGPGLSVCISWDCFSWGGLWPGVSGHTHGGVLAELSGQE
jgi:hypothetical protein